jgi:hypothetical protein
MTPQRSLLLLAVLLFGVSGCALVDVNLKAPESGLGKPIPGGNQRQVVVVIPFQDDRQIRTRCGVQKGGYGNETAVAVCQGDPAEWIASFLARELTASGFTVLRSADGARDAALRIEGVLLQIFAEPVVGFWSTTVETDMKVKLVATSKTGLQAERSFFSKGEVTNVIWPQGIFNDSVSSGTHDLLTKMVQAILELMNRYPELGFELRDGVVIVRSTEEAAR